MRSRLSAILVLALATSAWAGSNTGADFLKIPVGSRPVAMGQAYTALSNDVDAMNWNPAGLASVSRSATSGLTVSHQQLFAENNLDYAGFVFPVRGQAMGLNVLRLSYADQEERSANRTKTGSFGANDLMVGAAFGMALHRLSVGTHVKMIRQELQNESAQGYALDMGLSSPVNGKLTLAATARNLGPSMKFIREEFDLPLSLSMGAAYKVRGAFIMALDVQARPRQDQVAVALGSEFSPINTFSLRAGYIAYIAQAVASSQKSEINRGNPSNMSGINGGFGLRFQKFALDYAISPFGELGNTQTISLSTWFGGVKTLATPRSLDRNNKAIPADAPVKRDVMVIINAPISDTFLNGSSFGLK